MTRAHARAEAYRSCGAVRSLRSRPQNFGKLIAEETEKWAKVIKSVGIKAD